MTSDDGTSSPPSDVNTSNATVHTTRPAANTAPRRISWCDSYSKAQSAIESLSSILPRIPPSLLSSDAPTSALLHDPEVAKQFSELLRQPDSGGGDNNLCRWLYDTFQTSLPSLHLVVLRFLPVLAGVYLSRASLHKPLAGFEAVLLALYGYETTSRDGQALTVTIPDISHSSIYHESRQGMINDATELNMAVISPSLEPQGRVRSMRRARIVGVALELYYSKISEMPTDSKIEFCKFCRTWAGDFDDEHVENDDQDSQNNSKKSRGGRINLPWEILQPTFRILGHCLMGLDRNRNKELHEAACGACNALYIRSLHDLNPRAILAIDALFKLVKRDQEPTDIVDYTEITHTNVINI